MEEKIGKKSEKRPYETPVFSSEELFEGNVLACSKTPHDVGPCTRAHANPHST